MGTIPTEIALMTSLRKFCIRYQLFLSIPYAHLPVALYSHILQERHGFTAITLVANLRAPALSRSVMSLVVEVVLVAVCESTFCHLNTVTTSIHPDENPREQHSNFGRHATEKLNYIHTCNTHIYKFDSNRELYMISVDLHVI